MKAARGYVCVRVTDMRGVDLSIVRFDFDLTLAVLLMRPDGTVLHRFGGRTWDDGDAWNSVPALVRLLERTSKDEEEKEKAAPVAPRVPTPRWTIEDLPSFARRTAGKKAECVHCHTILESQRDEAIAADRFGPEDRWLHPAPERLGLLLDREAQDRVRAVTPGSPAHEAGLRPGDRLLRVGGRSTATFADVSAALHDLAPGATTVTVASERGGTAAETELRLADGWKRISALDYSWRNFQWGLRPQPGFGGKLLAADERRALGLGEGAFALRVGYLVDWGPDGDTGRHARASGLRVGDVVLSVGGKSDFRTERHFQTWFRFEAKPDTTVPIEILRKGSRETVQLRVLP